MLDLLMLFWILSSLVMLLVASPKIHTSPKAVAAVIFWPITIVVMLLATVAESILMQNDD